MAGGHARALKPTSNQLAGPVCRDVVTKGAVSPFFVLLRVHIGRRLELLCALCCGVPV